MGEVLPFLLALAVGGMTSLAADALVAWLSARRRRDVGSEPPRPALLALSYGENPTRASMEHTTPGIETLVAFALLALRPGIETWQIYVCVGFALLGVPGSWIEIHDFARRLTVRPVIAAREEGLYLTGWRGTVFLPWSEIALAYTDPPDTGGYVADERKVTLHVESKSGRRWRFSSRDFALGTPAEFDRLVDMVTLRTAPPGSMLTRDRF
jgi:hypothetical protein